MKGAAEQMKADHLLIAGCYGVQAATDDAEAVLHSQGPAEGYSGIYRDDLTGQVLKDSLVIEARRWSWRSSTARVCGQNNPWRQRNSRRVAHPSLSVGLTSTKGTR